LALQQPPFYELMTWIMINEDQQHHLKISWHGYMWFFSHFDSILNKGFINGFTTAACYAVASDGHLPADKASLDLCLSLLL
jgi:hypothetical protein